MGLRDNLDITLYETDDLPEWQERVVQERAELEHKLQKLSKFVDSDEFSRIPNRDRFLLEKQQELMAEYYEILGRRICNF